MQANPVPNTQNHPSPTPNAPSQLQTASDSINAPSQNQSESVIDTIEPRFVMSTSIESVLEVWNEWNNGVSPYPPIKVMEEKFKTKWRKSEKDRQFFSRRMRIIKEVLRIASHTNVNEVAAANQLENLRQANGWSLHKLSLELAKGFSSS